MLLIVIDPFPWIEPVAHLSERKVCARVKWISATSRLSCRVLNPRYGTFGKYSNKFGFRKNWISVTSPQFTIIMSCLQSTSSIHTSEHFVNIRTNIRTISAFEKIRLSDNFRFRIYAILHCLNQIPIFYYFLAKTCFHHNILSSSDTQKDLQNILLSAQWIVIPAKMIFACSLERR